MNKMKNKMKTAKKVIVIVTMLSVIAFIFTACGSAKLSGTYYPENPDDENVVFTSLRFEGKTVHIEAAGSTIGFGYVIKDGTFSFKENFNFTINGKQMPSSFTFVQSDDGSFTLDGIRYVAE